MSREIRSLLFGGARCARVTETVLARLGFNQALSDSPLESVDT